MNALESFTIHPGLLATNCRDGVNEAYQSYSKITVERKKYTLDYMSTNLAGENTLAICANPTQTNKYGDTSF